MPRKLAFGLVMVAVLNLPRTAAAADHSETDADPFKTARRSSAELVKAAAEQKDPRRRSALLTEARGILEPEIAALAGEAARTRKVYERTRSARRGRALEAAASAMQRHIAGLLECARVFTAGSPQRDELLQRAIAALERERRFYEAQNDMHGAVLWLDCSSGRAYALAGKYREACEEGLDLVLIEEPSAYRGRARDYVDELRKLAYYLKASAALEAGRHAEAVAVVDEMLSSPSGYPAAAAEDRGLAARLVRARALVRGARPDARRAVDECVEVIRRGKDRWAPEAGRVLAELLGAGHDAPADAEALLCAARGTYSLAQRAADERARTRGVHRSIALYEKVVAACRAPGTSLRVRLEREPSAWFEMGIRYAKLSLWYEAAFAFENIVRLFAKHEVGRRLAQQREFEPLWSRLRGQAQPGAARAPADVERHAHAALFDALAEREDMSAVLESIEAKLKKSAKNLVIAARRSMAASKWHFDRRLYLAALQTAISVNPEEALAHKFRVADARCAEAEDLRRNGKPVEAVAAWVEAAELWLECGEGRAELREAACHAAAKAFYRAMATRRDLSLPPSLDRRAPRFAELGARSLDAFARFERHVAAIPVSGGGAVARRKRLDEMNAARATVHYELGEYGRSIAAAEAFLKRARGRDVNVQAIRWTHLRAMCAVAAASVATPGEAGAVARMSEAAERLVREADAPERRLAACSLAAATLSRAGERLAKLAASVSADSRPDLVKRAASFRASAAEWMARLLEVDRSSGEDLGLVLSVAEVFREQNAHTRAAKLYRTALDSHDPSRRCRGRDFAADTFERAADVVVFPSEARTDEVRGKIRSLSVLVFGAAPKGLRVGTESARRRDWRKAREVCLGLLKAHPALPCAAELGRVADEMAFRLQVLSARLGLSECCRALAAAAGGKETAEGRRLWVEALLLLGEVRTYWARDNELRLLQAECCEALGRLDEALRLCAEAAGSVRDFSPTHYRAMTRYSRIAFAQGEYQKARAFPYVLLQTVPEPEWKSQFPDAREFVARCDTELAANGIKLRPPPAAAAPAGPTVAYENPPSANDRMLIAELRAIGRRIQLGFETERRREALQRNAFEVHIRRLFRDAVERPAAEGRAGRLSSSEVAEYQRKLLAPLLYQSPFTLSRLRELGGRLEVVPEPYAPAPLEGAPGAVVQKAIALGLLSGDGRRKALDQIPASLLRVESR